MKRVTRQEMKELDRQAIEEFGIPAIVLMENAGRVVAEEVLKLLDLSNPGQVVVLCGRGNNGGDGFVVARHLFNRNVPVSVVYFGLIAEALDRPAPGAAQVNLKIIKQMGVPIEESKDINVSAISNKIKVSKVIVDAIFGIGLERPVAGALKELIEQINTLKIPIVAVDVPSGLDADQGIPLGAAIRAARTVTFGAAKIGFFQPAAQPYLGKYQVADISIPRTLL